MSQPQSKEEHAEAALIQGCGSWKAMPMEGELMETDSGVHTATHNIYLL